jgi:cell wall assembly regulator SMI1
MEYKEAGPAAQRGDVERLEARIGRSLPEEYRTYLFAQDGGWAKDNTLAVDEIFGLREDAPYSGNMWEKLAVFGGRVPEWLLPVAQDVHGNLFAISLRDADIGSVWFWDHEEEADEGESPGEDNINQVATSWSAFLRDAMPIPEGDQN